MAKQRPRRRAIRPGAAKLRQFLDTHELSYASAGGELGVSAVTVWDWARGNKIPNADHREILATWTQDAVSAADWSARTVRPHAVCTGTEG